MLICLFLDWFETAAPFSRRINIVTMKRFSSANDLLRFVTKFLMRWSMVSQKRGNLSEQN